MVNAASQLIGTVSGGANSIVASRAVNDVQSAGTGARVEVAWNAVPDTTLVPSAAAHGRSPPHATGGTGCEVRFNDLIAGVSAVVSRASGGAPHYHEGDPIRRRLSCSVH